MVSTWRSFRSIELPPKSQLVESLQIGNPWLRSPQDGNKSMDSIVAIQSVTSKIDHLDFDERTVRDGLLAVSNDGSVAHAVSDYSTENSPSTPGRQDGPLLESASIKNPSHLPNRMSSWLVQWQGLRSLQQSFIYGKQDGAVLKIRGSKAGFYSNAQTVA